MIKLILWVIIGLVVIVTVKLGVAAESIADKRRCLHFIEGYNPIEGQRIFDAILNYRRGFSVAWLTALIWGESAFKPETITGGYDKGLGQLSPIALAEINRVYGVEIDYTRLFEIEYNIYLTGLFAERCKEAATWHAVGKYKLLYATYMTYKDWLDWTDWTQTKALRSWEIYQALKYNYRTERYESERV